MNLNVLDDELRRDEGEKLYLYDDATDKPIVKGSSVEGIPTLGVGINVTFLYPEESKWLLENRRNRAIADLTTVVSWYSRLDDVRQRAVTNLYFNIPSFVHWPNFMRLMSASLWKDAATELRNTHPWIDEVKQRGIRIADMIETGITTV